jgi:hypothetical protein
MAIRGRAPIGYVVEVDGPDIAINLNEDHRGQVAAHAQGISFIGQPNDFIAADGGSNIIVLRVISIAYAEPREAHRAGVGTSVVTSEPLRQIRGRAVGYLQRADGELKFIAQEWQLPALGAEAFPLTMDEQRAAISPESREPIRIRLGHDARQLIIPIEVPAKDLLPRHMAILGSTGQGKSSFLAALVQQLLAKLQRPRIVIFDVNGEYPSAFANLGPHIVRRTVLGPGPDAGGVHHYRIPYYALGRHGLARLLMPSERAQMPALRFAVEHLKYLRTEGDGAGLANGPIVFFDDCRPGPAAPAAEAIRHLRDGDAELANSWPHMRALACVIADWYSIQPNNRGGMERNSFNYGHVQSLINRIRSLIDDELFRRVVDVEGGPGQGGELSLGRESRAAVDRLFGPAAWNDDGWRVHIVDLSQVAQDLMPFVLGSLLELFASELFRRGPGETHPTILGLEEAHHYLRPLGNEDESAVNALAYERLAKEGRKFNVSLAVSTQRPSEVSATVLAQCGTWVVFRLTNEQDQKAVAAGVPSGSSYIIRQLSGLARGQAIVFGSGLPIPVLTAVIRAAPEPKSADAEFI